LVGGGGGHSVRSHGDDHRPQHPCELDATSSRAALVDAAAGAAQAADAAHNEGHHQGDDDDRQQ